jgi:Cdc6-like AAA superfamily ATPase
MTDSLEQLVRDIRALQSPLILLVGPPGSGKTQRLRQLAAKLSSESINVGLELARLLAATPNNKRGFSAGELLREITNNHKTGDLLLLDNLELLFEPSLQINPLDLIKRLAHAQPVVAVWPGELRGDRLTYADMSHPEHRDYSREGVVVFEV